jgi:hypothetical protein
MAGKDIAVKKHVVRLTAEEREQLQVLIRKGKSPARRRLKARFVLKADVSDAGEGWSDRAIIKALDTSESMVYRVRRELGEEDFEAVLSRKPRTTPPVPGDFRLREGSQADRLGMLQTAEGTRAMDVTAVGEQGRGTRYRRACERLNSTIGRALKKHSPTPLPAVLGHPAEGQQRFRSRNGRRARRLHAAT